jgi:diaminohydroxyphosphoribosylaminopyrimidine deaminase/5-amino-6-(5-phosphoribosylamino)uracil reductase
MCKKMRARSSAIVTGIGTLLADDPSLTVRVEGEDWYPENQVIRQPLRVVVDSQLKTPADAKLFTTAGEVVIAIASNESRADVKTIQLANSADEVDLTVLLQALAKLQVNEVMVEAGSVLNGALLKAKLIDECVFYIAPKLMGDQAKGLFHLPELQTMAQNLDLQIKDIRAVGKDWRVTAQPIY